MLLDYLIPTYQPDVLTLWMSDPDHTQHKTTVGGPVALDAIRRADAQFGRILAYLEANGLANSTDIFVPSDHGHSTVTEQIDVAEVLIEQGIKQDVNSTDALVAKNGGCETIYVRDSNERKIRSTVESLMQQAWCGPIFTRNGIEGTFPMSLILYGHERAPDILMSFAWDADENEHGVAGRFYSSGLPSGRGDHGSLSPYEIRNTLVAAGSHFKQGILNHLPSGNVDIFPTILSILGLAPPDEIDGRVLAEALINGPQPQEVFVQTNVHTASTVVNNMRYTQQLQVSHVGDTLYPDKGRALRQTVVA